jgi:exopolysaccharide biosynthesis protein
MILISVLQCFSQDASDAEGNCYQKYAKIFETRGAFDVEDGTYTDVILSFRKGSNADCFNGKVIIENKHVKKMYIKFSDNSFEEIERNWKNDVSKIQIVNGISETFLTKEDELINVMFVKKIKPKKKEYQRAAEAPIDSY